jgi:hypothetical protein
MFAVVLDERKSGQLWSQIFADCLVPIKEDFWVLSGTCIGLVGITAELDCDISQKLHMQRGPLLWMLRLMPLHDSLG